MSLRPLALALASFAVALAACSGTTTPLPGGPPPEYEPGRPFNPPGASAAPAAPPAPASAAPAAPPSK